MSLSESNVVRDRRVLITGAARGLGLEFATSLARAGAHIAMADILAEPLQTAVASLRAEGLSVHGMTVDVSNPESITECANEAVRSLGGLDGLVNNAAITNSGGVSAMDLSVDVWDRVMQVNVRGTWLMSLACHAALKASGHGAIVNLASDTTLWGATNLLAYVASKGAIEAMTSALAEQFWADHITVNAIAPGLTVVEATEYVPEARRQLNLDMRALRREQMPSDLTGSVMFALSSLSRSVTGQLLPVNGGFMMR